MKTFKLGMTVRDTFKQVWTLTDMTLSNVTVTHKASKSTMHMSWPMFETYFDIQP